MEENDLEAEIANASADVEQLKFANLPVERLLATLAQRYSKPVLQRLFPGATIPDREKRTEKLGFPIVPARRGVSEPRSMVPLEEGVLRVQSLIGAQSEESRKAVARAVQTVDELAFQYVPLIQCTFPHSELTDVSTYTRLNGRLETTIATSREGVGLPYGVPARLLTIFAATEVVRTKSREIFLGRSVTDFLNRLDVPVSWGQRGTVHAYRDQLKRLIHAVFTVEENIDDGAGRKGIHMRKVLFAEEARLWDDVGEKEGSVIVLSEPLFESMLERSAPLSWEAIRILRKSPLDLDVYAWLVYRLYQLRRPIIVPWQALMLQFGQSYTRPRDFRTFFQTSLKRVLCVYPDAKAEVTKDGLKLQSSRAHVRPTKTPT